jgi:hypothetical protein
MTENTFTDETEKIWKMDPETQKDDASMSIFGRFKIKST